jgi:hypothetical protein
MSISASSLSCGIVADIVILGQRFLVIETRACAATGRLPAYRIAARSATVATMLSWTEHQTTNLRVGRSNRSGRAIYHLCLGPLTAGAAGCGAEDFG